MAQVETITLTNVIHPDFFYGKDRSEIIGLSWFQAKQMLHRSPWVSNLTAAVHADALSTLFELTIKKNRRKMVGYSGVVLACIWTRTTPAQTPKELREGYRFYLIRSLDEKPKATSNEPTCCGGVPLEHGVCPICGDKL